MINQETLKTFENLYYETYNDVLKYVICNCSNIEDVRDIVQNVYFEVLKKIKKDSKREISKAYIMGITKNKVKDYYRFNYKVKLISLFTPKEDLSLEEVLPSKENLEDNFLEREDIELIWKFLKKRK